MLTNLHFPQEDQRHKHQRNTKQASALSLTSNHASWVKILLKKVKKPGVLTHSSIPRP